MLNEFILEFKEDDDFRIGAYLIRHVPTGVFYVGSTGDLKHRLRKHKEALCRGNHPNTRLQEVWNLNPLFSVSFNPVEDDGSPFEVLREKAYDAEQALLDEHWGSEFLLNRSNDARNPLAEVVTNSDESNRKRSESMIRRWEDEEYRDRVSKLLGEHRRTDEAKQRQSEISTAFWSDPMQRIRQSAAMNNPETMAENIRKNKERWDDPEHRKKMLDQRQTPEYQEKFRQGIQGRMKRVSIDGVIYESLIDAARKLKARVATIAARCRSSKFPNYFIVPLDRTEL